MQSDETADLVDLRAVFSAVRRQAWIAAAFVVVALAFAAVYLLLAVPRYTAWTAIMIDPAASKIVDQFSAVGGIVEDEASILSQVELLKSKQIALSVADSLGLSADEDFLSEPPSFIGGIAGGVRSILSLRWLGLGGGSESAQSPEQASESAALRLANALGVTRVGRTYVLRVSYTSSNPALATRIADAFAEAYLVDQLDSKYEATRRAGVWLQERIAELREQSLASDLAVQKFRSDNNLIATNGELLSDQQLSQINAQLIIAQGDVAEAQAKLDSIRAILQSGDMDAVVTDALTMPAISTMREKYLEASRQEADIAARLGSDHAQAVRLRNEMSEYRRLMFEELDRLAQSYESSYNIAKARQDALLNQVAEATGVSADANDSLVQLRELEREAETYRNLYQTFLQRYQESVQQQSFPITEARVITRATVPASPSSPSVPFTFAVAAAIGLFFGASAGAVREFRERYYRTPDQLRADLPFEFLGIVPLIADETARPRRRLRGKQPKLPNDVHHTRSISAFVVEHPTSPFAETMRSAKLAVDLKTDQKRPKIIGITSALPGEGKSAISMNFAAQIARQGAKTLLIDADLRNSSTSRVLAPDADAGLVEALLDGGIKLGALLRTDPETGLHFLPGSSRPGLAYTSELISSEGMRRLLAAAYGYDYIVIDLPPLAPVIDARAIAPKIDAFLFVVEWGRTPRHVVQTTLQEEWLVAERCAGVILNKVDTKRLRLYEAGGFATYSGGNYGDYTSKT